VAGILRREPLRPTLDRGGLDVFAPWAAGQCLPRGRHKMRERAGEVTDAEAAFALRASGARLPVSPTTGGALSCPAQNQEQSLVEPGGVAPGPSQPRGCPPGK